MAVRLSRRKLSDYYVQSLINGMDSKKLAMQLAAYLFESKRTKELHLIINDIDYQLSQHGIVAASVTSAHKLDELTKIAVTSLINKSIMAKHIQLSEKVDPNVLGGLKLEFTGSELDTTIARRLTKLKTNFKKL